MPATRAFYLILACVIFASCLSAEAATVDATWNSATDVPVTTSSYTATGNTVNFALNFTPATGTNLTVVNNTGLPFISGTFDNLAQGQAVSLSYGGVTYNFVAHYYGGTGNDLVLVAPAYFPATASSTAPSRTSQASRRASSVTVRGGQILTVWPQAPTGAKRSRPRW
jgi:hypothetical protein